MMNNFDPSNMDPKVMMELSQLVSQLPPDKLNKMQSLMHNMMAGYDVSKEMEEFEKSLPAGFREKLFSIMANQPMSAFMGGPTPGGPTPPNFSSIQPMGGQVTGTNSTPEVISGPEATPVSSEDLSLREARLTILRAVAAGRMSPEEAEHLLFNT